MAGIVFGLSLAASLAGAAAAGDAVDRAAALDFQTEVIKISTAIEDRFLAHEQVLRGGLALWDANEQVTRTQWRAYVSSLRLEDNYPGIQGVGYAAFVPADRQDEHVSHIQNQTDEVGPEHRPVIANYSLRREEDLGTYTSIIYLEPFDLRNQQAFGYDMYSNLTRRTAMDRAIAENDAALSGRVTLVQEIDDDIQPGFLVYLPHYAPGAPVDTVEERRAAILGFVYSPFRARDLMTGILGDTELDVTFEVYDGLMMQNGTEVYDDDGTLHFEDAAHDPRLRERQVIEIAGRPWTVYYHTTSSFEAAHDDTLAMVIFGGGSVLGLLIAGIVLSLATTRARATTMATHMTQELRESKARIDALAARLARSNEDLQQFAYIASHDLQEPVRTVASYMGLLRHRYAEDLPDDAKEFIDVAESGAKRMHGLILDLLDFSRVETEGETDAVVDPHAAFDEALSNLDVQIREANPEVEQAEDLPLVSADQPQLTRVFQNLVANAIKYRKEHEPCRIALETVPSEDPAMVHFALRDNGIGIDPKHHDRLFVMFSRLHPRDRYPGTGMGLAICKRILLKHGGDIWIESELGEGTTFHFTLPKAK